MPTTEKAKVELTRLVDLFKSGNVPQALSHVVLTCPNMPSSKWTLSNRLMAFLQCFETDCRGFRQWEKVGRRVRKGAKAVYILRPNTIKKVDEESGEEQIICRGFSCCPVFAFSDTEGEPLDGLYPSTPPPLSQVAESFGLTVDYQAFGGTYYGFFRPSVDKIVLCTHDEQVFFHELAHAAHRRVMEDLKSGQDPRQEIVAELSACVMARLYGRKQADEGNSYEYGQQYADAMKKDLCEVIVSVIHDVEKVLNAIITTAEAKAVA
jgi:antirestriction protein ArdC